MIAIYKAFFLLIISGFVCIQSFAQPVKYTSALNAGGGSKDISGNNYEWSVGEMVLVNTGVSSGIIVTQGVLQPAQGTGDINGRSRMLDNVSVYPVPSQSIVYLQYDFPAPGELQYELTDITGKLLLQSELKVQPGTGKQAIDLGDLANASYMLNVVYRPATGNASGTSFKLEKIN